MNAKKYELKEFDFINVANCFSVEPAQLDFVLPGFVAGTVGGLVSPGGIGKSTFALQICISIACSIDESQEASC
jgi:predicted ATP-dependent serine protease